MTIKEICEIYFNYAQLKHKPSTIKNDKHILNRFLTYFTENYDADNLKQINIELWLLQINIKHPSLAHLCYRTLKAMFNWALKNEMVKKNPFTGLKLPRKKLKHPAFITKEELSEILMNEPTEYMRDIYIIAFYSGLRLGELINLEWRNVHMDKKIIIVANTDTFSTKSGKDRVVPLCGQIYDVLSKLNNIRGENKYVVKHLNPSYISHRFLKATRKTSLNNREIHFHSLRHSFASNLVCKGVSLYTVKELLGHSDYSTTQIYAHLQTKSLKEAVDQLDNI